MPDNVKIQAGTGDDTAAPPVATDLVGGQHYQRIKAGWGVDGTWVETADAAGTRFPVVDVHEGVITCTVTNGQTVSAAVDLAGYSNVGLIVPATFDGTAITFQVSDLVGGTYVALYDITNTQVAMTIAASRAYDLPGELMVWRFLKIVCGTAQSVTNTDFLLVAKVMTGKAYQAGQPAMVLLATATPSGVGEYVFTNISQAYTTLQFMLAMHGSSSAIALLAQCSTDGTTMDSGANYDTQYVQGSGAAATAGESLAQSTMQVCQETTFADTMVTALITFPNYTSTTYHKTMQSTSAYKDSNASGGLQSAIFSGCWRNLAALKGVRFTFGFPGTFSAGSVIKLYGLR